MVSQFKKIVKLKKVGSHLKWNKLHISCDDRYIQYANMPDTIDFIT